MTITNELANEIENYLKERLGSHPYILLLGESGTSHSGVITNLDGKSMTAVLECFAEAARNTWEVGNN